MFGGIFGGFVDWIKVWVVRIIVICFLFGISVAGLHGDISHMVHTIEQALTGHSGISLPGIKKK